MTPVVLAIAAAAAVATFLSLRRQDCFDANLTEAERAMAEKLLAPETGKEKLSDLVVRAGFMAKAAAIAARQGKPKLAACLAQRAMLLGRAIKRGGGKGAKAPADALEGQLPPPEHQGLGVDAKASKKAKKAAKKAKKAAKKGKAMKAATFGQFKLPLDGGPAREKRILELVGKGKLRPYKWIAVNLSRDGINAVVWVADQAMQLQADDGSLLLFNVRHTTADTIAQHEGALLPTARIMDAAFKQADTRLRHHQFKADHTMDDTSTMYKHSKAVANDMGARGGLVRPMGKAWINSNRFFHPVNKHPPEQSAINYGWHLWPPVSKHAKYHSADGAAVIQPRSTFHSNAHTDYSQVVYLVRDEALVNGKKIKLADLYKHPTFAKVVSDEGPLQRARHPALPDEGSAAVA